MHGSRHGSRNCTTVCRKEWVGSKRGTQKVRVWDVFKLIGEFLWDFRLAASQADPAQVGVSIKSPIHMSVPPVNIYTLEPRLGNMEAHSLIFMSWPGDGLLQAALD